MLAALQAHSRSLLGIDGPEEAESSAQAQARSAQDSSDEDGKGVGEDEDEEAEEFQSDDGWGAEDDFVTDSEDGEVESSEMEVRQAPKETKSKMPEVVFAPQNNSSMDVLSKSERRAFLVSPPGPLEIELGEPQTDTL